MKVTMIVGLPASGKTHMAYHIAGKTGGHVIDELGFDTQLKIDFINAIRPNHVVITDHGAIFAGPQKVRDQLTKWLNPDEIEFIVFANDVDQCYENLDKRGGLRSKINLDAYKNYDPEQWEGTIVPVWS